MYSGGIDITRLHSILALHPMIQPDPLTLLGEVHKTPQNEFRSFQLGNAL